MRMLVIAAGVLGLATAWMALPQAAQAQDKKVFALVPKLVGVPFYSDVETGCKAEAQKIGVECLFTGGTQVDEAEQVRVIRDLITKNVSGLAIAPNNPASVASAIEAAQAKGIPVITFDSDAPNSKRTAFVGTNNRQGGEEGGKVFKATLPSGGKYAVITGGLAADNLNERIDGFKSQLGSGFTEVAGSPYPCEDDANRGVQLVQDVLAKNPDLVGFFFSGGWPMFAPQAYARAVKSKLDDLKAGKFAVVAFDVQDAQLQLLKQGYATALVGQRPMMMGAKSIDVLNQLASKQTVPPVVDTGVDIVTTKNVEGYKKQ
jgi:ribose transport system substrate-binding protein